MLEVKIDEHKKIEKKNLPTTSSKLQPLMIYQTSTSESDNSMTMTYIEPKKLTFEEAFDKVLEDDDELLKRLAD